MTEKLNDDALVCDILIIGYGIAGASAALEARARGVDALVLERATGGGGTSAMSEGVFYMGGGTALQRDLGIEDDAESMYTFMEATCGVSDKAVLRRFCDENVEHFDWLEAQGVPFARKLYTGKHLCPSHGEGLYSTGNEKVFPFRDMARPAYRGHLVTGPAGNAGSKAMEVLVQRCEEAGVRLVGDARVTGLVVDDAGRVTGARFRREGVDYTAHARMGVVLATGGFQMNKDMVARENAFLVEHGLAIGTDYSDGSGIEIAQEIGADVDSIGAVNATASFYPPSQLVKGIIVNRLGKRFVAEDSYHGRTSSFIFEQPDQKAWLIVDSEVFAYPRAKVFRYNLVDGWETIAEMEAALGMPEGALQKTMADFNAHAHAGTDPEFGKHPDWIKPLDQGPWAAFDMSVGEVLYHYHSLGGLRVNADAQVIDTAGKPIPGLYAAGSCAATVVHTGKGYGSGMTLSSGSLFGRVATRHALEQMAAA